MTFYQGKPAVLAVEVRNSAGTLVDSQPALGLVRPDGTVFAGPAVAHVGLGSYSATVTPDQIGTWLRTWTPVAGTVLSVAEFDQFYVISPIARIAGIDEVKQHGNITSSTADRELIEFIGTAQAIIEGHVGACVPTAYSETHMSGSGSIWLYHRPVLSVTSIQEYHGSIALTTIDAAAYVVDLGSGEVRRATASVPTGRWLGTTVQAVYRAGRDPIPEAIRWGAKELAIHLWRSTQSLRGGRARGSVEDVNPNGAPFALPNRVLEAIHPYLLPPVVA